jgi:hypothetical protein
VSIMLTVAACISAWLCACFPLFLCCRGTLAGRRTLSQQPLIRRLGQTPLQPRFTFCNKRLFDHLRPCRCRFKSLSSVHSTWSVSAQYCYLC